MFSKTSASHISHVRSVLTLLWDADRTMKLKRCEFFTCSICYLGRITRPGSLKTTSQRSGAIHNLKSPTTLTKPKYFLGLCNVFRRFVPNFLGVAALFNKKTPERSANKVHTINSRRCSSCERLAKQVDFAAGTRLTASC